MEGICGTVISQDEFECAECDYKAGTETEMIDHSETHSGEEDHMINSSKVINKLDKENNENVYKDYVLVNMKSECISVIKSDPCTMSTDVNNIQNKCSEHINNFVKCEIDYVENYIPDRDQCEINCKNMVTKLEDNENNDELCVYTDKLPHHEIVKHESDPLYIEISSSSHQPHTYENNPLNIKDPKIPGIIGEIDNTGIYIPDGWQRKLYQITKGREVGSYKAIYISPTGKIIHNKYQLPKISKSKKQFGIRSPIGVDITKLNFNAGLGIPRIKHRVKRVEIGVDNSNAYIPNGWKRKAFESLNGSMRKWVCYISPFNREIFDLITMKTYIAQLESEGHSLSVDIEKLSFRYSEAKETEITGGDVGINNTGTYIPNGWRRKEHRVAEGTAKGNYRAYYISPTGKRLYCKSELSRHIKYLEEHGIKSHVDLKLLDFTISSQNLPTTVEKKQTKRDNKVEIEVDNTNVYIPDGWERKAYKFIDCLRNGKRKVFYISPFNRLVHSKQYMRKYLAHLEKKGCKLSVDIESLNLTLKGVV